MRVREEQDRIATQAPGRKLCPFRAGEWFRTIGIERAAPEHRRPRARCDKDDLTFVRRDRRVERFVARAELSARRSAKRQREWGSWWWRHLAERRHHRDRQAA